MSGMSLIYFYDATELDKQQLTAELQHTDHHWEYVDEPISPTNLNPDTEVISGFVTSVVTSEIIEKLPKLKLIACRSTGFNNIDLQAAEAHGVTVVNVPSYGEKTVAEYAFSLLLALSRKLPQAIGSIDTADQPHMMGFDLNGKTLGVIGTGRIGMNAIRIAKGFAMEVIAYDPFPKPEMATEIGFTYVDFDTLLANSDVISLHVPFTGSNAHLINDAAIAKMKKGVTLINTSRGELVDTAALLRGLQDGHIGHAGLDVFEDEHIMSLKGVLELIQDKHVSTSEDYFHSIEMLALQKFPNVILTPHNAFNTLEALGRINQTTADNIVKFWYGNIPNKVSVQHKNGTLLIARHAESEWNALGKWTGTTDVHLSEKGFHDAGLLGRLLPANVHIDKAYASQQIRTLETLEGMLDSSQQFEVDIERSGAINERDYGDYTGKNKWEVKEQIGEEQFNAIRREWDVHVPNGETLKVVFERVYPFYRDVIVPQLREGKNILLVAHGNSIRALMHFIESIPTDKMGDVEMLFGSILQYEVDDDGKMKNKKVLSIESPKPPA